MTVIDTVVIGAGHAGLGVSRLLTDAGRDHVVLDRGRIGERWRTERWDSLHLLTPNWMTRLPGWHLDGPDPDGFLSRDEFVRLLEEYAASFGAPVITEVTVQELVAAPVASGHRYRVTTDRGTWHARNVVIATGPHGVPHVPSGIQPADVVTSDHYRNPGQLPDGAVLVVGASSSGVQIADELSRAGREVTLAVGRHTRMPRRYRGMDIFWWLEATGRLARTIDDMPDAAAARQETSLQLIGRNERGRRALDLDLGVLQDRGVRLVGRLDGISGRTATFRADLRQTVAAADAALHRFLEAVDRYVDRAGLEREVWAGLRPRPVVVGGAPTRLDLRAERINAVVLATGYRPHHPWLRLPICAPDGSIRQRRGATDAPGVYTVGQRFQHRRDSGFIHGARYDARAVVDHLLGSSAHPDAVPTGEAAP
jgi:putative flavoprotein involved in K+ transport